MSNVCLYLFCRLALCGYCQAQQHPVLDMIAQRAVPQKYQGIGRPQQSREQKGKPKSQREQEAIHMRAMIRTWPRTLNQVAGPIANKMFRCVKIP